jgi:hypothetical protein
MENNPPFYVTDPWHFLDEHGMIPRNLPAPAKKLIAFLGRIIEETSLKPPGESVKIGLKCFRRPGRKACPGEIWAHRERRESSILWKCTGCSAGGQACPN